ncbi:hypothetical protein EON77_07135, partial [bacterium]
MSPEPCTCCRAKRGIRRFIPNDGRTQPIAANALRRVTPMNDAFINVRALPIVARDAALARPGFAATIYRTGSVANLTDDAAAGFVAATGVRTFVDLRTAAERSRDGTPAALVRAGVDVVHHAIDEGATAVRASASPGPRDYTASYLAMVPLAMDAVETILALARELPRLPLAFGCTAGKDRTGVVAALLLRGFGVDDDVIVDDYART